MRMLTLPQTDLRVSQICLGTAELGLKVDEEQSFRLLDACVSAGGNFLDTAHCYSDWAPGESSRSEKLMGRWMKSRGNRGRLVLATKGGIDFRAPGGARISLSAEALDREIKQSLAFLQTDRIDLYWLHRDEPSRSVGEILLALHRHMAAGRIGHIGCSNWRPSRIAEANAWAAANGLRPFVANQVEWSLARTLKPETPLDGSLPFMDAEAMDFHRRSGMTALAFSAQARGFYSLLDRLGEAGLPEHLRRHYLNDANLAACRRLKELSASTGATVAALSLAYISWQPQFTGVPIIFTSRLEHLAESLGAADLRLTPQQLAFLEGK